MQKLHPPEKCHPSFPATLLYLSKPPPCIEILSSPLFFENFGGGSTLSRKERGSHYEGLYILCPMKSKQPIDTNAKTIPYVTLSVPYMTLYL